ncbi:hypothetical protein PUV44_12575 [Xanthomonas arboricola pv. corylina]|nr:hypothetical protein PUV44_12575 [Xanthomonas arboricola pv. corylina]
MDTTTPPSAFAQLQLQLETASDPWLTVEKFEAALLAKYPAQAAEVVELMTHWLHVLGMIEARDMRGFI